jgi:type VI protein secretion system component VasK
VGISYVVQGEIMWWLVYVVVALVVAIFFGGLIYELARRRGFNEVDRNISAAFWPIAWIVFLIVSVARLPKWMLASKKPPKIIIEKGAKITDHDQSLHLKRLVSEWEKGTKKGQYR